MKQVLVFATLLWMAGCNYTAEKFSEDFEESFCAFDASCSNPFYGSVAECRNDLQSDRDTDCTYDDEQAKACIDALSGLSCEGALANFPPACNTACY